MIETLYVTQSGAGDQDGTSLENAWSVADFHTAANWANPKQLGKIGPGDTVHLNGTFTGTGGQVILYPSGSGSVGDVITILFDEDAVLTSPYMGADTVAGIFIATKNYLTIDGGVNGVIKNTANGTAFDNKQPSTGIFLSGTTGVEIKNLTIQDIYVNGGSDPDATDSNGLNTSNIRVANGNTNLSIHDNVLTAARAGIRFDFAAQTLSDISIYNNTITDHCWGIMIGSGNTGGSATGIKIYNNDFSGFLNWQCPANAAYCSNKTDSYHTDGVILYGYKGYPVVADIYGNYFHGTLGNASPTAWVYCTHGGGSSGNGTECRIFNNIFHETSDRKANWISSASGPTEFYNNTLIGQDTTAGVMLLATGYAIKVKNNLFISKKVGIGSYSDAATDIFAAAEDCDYNVWVLQDGSKFYFGDGATWYTWAQWQALGYDAHSSLVNPNLDGSYKIPSAESSAYQSGVNLTSLGIAALNVDRDGLPRPAVGPWNMGAYEQPFGTGRMRLNVR